MFKNIYTIAKTFYENKITGLYSRVITAVTVND